MVQDNLQAQLPEVLVHAHMCQTNFLGNSRIVQTEGKFLVVWNWIALQTEEEEEEEEGTLVEVGLTTSS